jgi:hypothetical protein
MPAEWRQNAAVVPVFETPQGLISGPELSDEIPEPRITTASSSPTVFVPGDRDEALSRLSGAEGAVYLLGGLRGDSATGEIWRYDLRTGRWRHLFTSPVEPGTEDDDGVPQAQPGSVLAAAYHAESGKLVILDEVEAERFDPPEDATPAAFGSGFGPHHFHPGGFIHRHRHRRHGGQKFVRFLVFDVRHNRSSVALIVPRTGLFGRPRLVSCDDGRFIVVVQKARHPHWTAFEFSIETRDRIKWRARVGGHGQVLDRPISTTTGVFVPLSRQGRLELLPLEEEMFRPWREGCKEL